MCASLLSVHAHKYVGTCKGRLPHMHNNKGVSLLRLLTPCIIGASLSEPHINGTAMHELYIYIYYYYYGTSVTRNLCPAWLHGHKHKYSIAHSHAWTTGRIYAVLV